MADPQAKGWAEGRFQEALKIDSYAVLFPIAIARRAELLVILNRLGIRRRIVGPMRGLLERLFMFGFAHSYKMRPLALSFKRG